MTRFVVFLALVSGCAHGALLQVGTNAPDGALQDQSGHERTISSFRGHPTVVYFYPRDATPGCTREACAFRDAWARYEAAGIQIVGVSRDTSQSHAEFANDEHLPFPILADPDGTLTRAYGVKSHLGMASRVTFLLDANGVVRAVFRDVDPGVHADQVLTEATRLGLVTPTATAEPAESAAPAPTATP